MNSSYVGSELDLFSGATHWKSYWASIIRPYLGARILDVGAGIGATARTFAGIKCDHYLALEPDQSLVDRMKRAQAEGACPDRFEVMTGTSSELGSEQAFDTILYIDVLEHICEDRAELERAAMHLLPNGCIIVLSPAHQWLFSAFDQAIGHVRRYNKRSLLAAKPISLVAERLFYLDSVGLLASLGNRLLLRAASPSAGQIKVWDSWMVPASTKLDKLTRFGFGKSVVAVFRQPG